VPERRESVPFINKVSSATEAANAFTLAEEILSRQHPQIERVVLRGNKESGEASNHRGAPGIVSPGCLLILATAAPMV